MENKKEEVVKRKGKQLHEIVGTLSIGDCETFIDSTLNDYDGTLKEQFPSENERNGMDINEEIIRIPIREIIRLAITRPQLMTPKEVEDTIFLLLTQQINKREHQKKSEMKNI